MADHVAGVEHAGAVEQEQRAERDHGEAQEQPAEVEDTARPVAAGGLEAYRGEVKVVMAALLCSR